MGKGKKCMNIFCKKEAGYGYKNGPRQYCNDHKKDDMINLRGYICAEENCIQRAAFAFKKDDKKLYCGSHKKLNMVNVLNKTCSHKGCIIQPCYNVAGEKRGKYCKKHKLKNMIDVTKHTCQNENCDTIPCFGYPQDGIKLFCTRHKLEGMEDLTKRKCIHDGCQTVSNFNYEGESKALYCETHKLDKMININIKRCQYAGCQIAASYNYKGLPDRKFCSLHKDPEMVLISVKLCDFENCEKSPSYGYPDQYATRCLEHKDPEMINVKHKRCNHENCDIIATFNFPDNRPLTCKGHSLIGMIDVTAIRCDECVTTAGYALPGNKVHKCARHKQPGHIINPRKRCIIEGCNVIAIYGTTKQIHCENHKEDNEYNLIERTCASCGLTMILNDQSLCGFCDPTMIKTFRLFKQKEIKTLLDNNNYKYTIYDGIVDSHCNYKRPDFAFDAGTHFVVLEVDENAHNNKKYNKENDSNYTCEEVRMINIAQAIGMNTIFIRYNPDNYKVKGIPQPPLNTRRHTILLKTLDHYLKIENVTNFLNVVYLFYDDFDETNIQMKEIKI